MNTENHLMIEQQGKLGIITLDRVTHPQRIVARYD